MAQTDATAPPIQTASQPAPEPLARPPSETAAIGRTRDYYFAILPGAAAYHVAHEGTTLCGIDLHEKDRWYKRGSERLIPDGLRLCHFCDNAFHRELALSKTHLREALAELAGLERTGAGEFSKDELAGLLAAFRGRVG